MRRAIVFEARRDGYGIDQIADSAMTVGELMEILQNFSKDTIIVMSHDNGYTYGSIESCSGMMRESRELDDGEWETTSW